MTLASRLPRPFLIAAVAALVTLATSTPVRAYTYETLQTEGCHEQITQAALFRIRAELDTAAPLEATDHDQVAIDDLPFTVESSIYRDIGAVSLLIGVRDNDLKGRSGLSAKELALVHGAADNQKEHCLRRPEHDVPGGSEEALADCRAFILERFDDALAGLDEDGYPQREDRVALDVNLAFRGTVTLPLPRTYVRLGQAMHALQDGFTHTMRTADGLRVTAVLNWFDVVEGQHHEPRDGPPHMSDLDDCALDEPLIDERRALAEEASVALLRAAFDPTLTPEEKHGQAEAVLGDYLTYEPGCSYADDWCDAPENAFRDGACLCTAPGGATSSDGWGLAALGLALSSWRRRRRRRGQSRPIGGPALMTAGIFAAAMTVADGAEAHDPAKWNEQRREGFGLHTSIGGSLDNGAFAAVLGARYGITNHWLIGLDVEYNPWFSFDARRLSRGVGSGYFVGMYRFPVSDDLALRTIGRLGASVMLFDLVGVPAGSVGPFLGLTPLGISYEMARNVYLIVDPLQIAVPVPKITDAPFAYRQYRFTIGFQLGA